MATTVRAKDEHYQLLVKMYLEDIEEHTERAQAFARALINRYSTLIALEGDTICGTISWEIKGGLDDGIAEIVGLGVRPHFRRKGVASTLMDSAVVAINRAFYEGGEKLRLLFLYMEAGNLIASSFYAKLGFKEAATIPSFYPDGDASILTREF
jgi:ribosomal protein S18 acetylase RimI-like enzyme